MSLFDLRRWYFDVITDGGDVLCVQIVLHRVLASRRALLSAHLVTPDGRQVREAAALHGAAMKNDQITEAAGRWIARTAAGLRLFLDLPGLQVDLLFAPAGDWHPNGKGVLLSRGRRSISWEVPLFRTAVSGTIGTGLDKRDARGIGYHDLIRTDIPPWGLPVRELVWGRAHFPSASLVWHQLTTSEGAVLQNVLAKQDGEAAGEPGGNAGVRPRPRWIDDYQFRLADPAGSGALVVSHPAFSLALDDDRVLDDGPVRAPSRIAWPTLGPALDGLSRRPEERRAVSSAKLEMGGRRERGLAVHTRLVWPGPAGAGRLRS